MVRRFLKICAYVIIGIFILCVWSEVSDQYPVFGTFIMVIGINGGVYYAGVRHRRRFALKHPPQSKAQPPHEIRRYEVHEVKELPALPSRQEESFWKPFDPNPLPIKPENEDGLSSPMDGESIEIIYTDAEENITQRTIELRYFQYSQQGREIFPYSIKAFCKLRREWRNFLVRRIKKATTMTGQTIRKADLLQFLILHSDIPRQEEGEEKDEIGLIKPRVLILVGYADPARKPTPYVLHLSSMSVIIGRTYGLKSMRVKKLTGYCERLQRDRSINYDRIIAMCNPDTGEIIEDQIGFLEAHRIS